MHRLKKRVDTDIRDVDWKNAQPLDRIHAEERTRLMRYVREPLQIVTIPVGIRNPGDGDDARTRRNFAPQNLGRQSLAGRCEQSDVDAAAA